MQPTFVRSIRMPGSPTVNPARLANATDVPLRLVVRVSGGGSAALALSIADLTPDVSSESIEADGSWIIIVLAPRQTLYAVGVGASVTVSVAASEAYPVI